MILTAAHFHRSERKIAMCRQFAYVESGRPWFGRHLITGLNCLELLRPRTRGSVCRECVPGGMQYSPTPYSDYNIHKAAYNKSLLKANSHCQTLSKDYQIL